MTCLVDAFKSQPTAVNFATPVDSRQSSTARIYPHLELPKGTGVAATGKEFRITRIQDFRRYPRGRGTSPGMGLPNTGDDIANSRTCVGVAESAKDSHDIHASLMVVVGPKPAPVAPSHAGLDPRKRRHTMTPCDDDELQQGKLPTLAAARDTDCRPSPSAV